ncbi:bicarbonate transporter, eukaryotic [Kipferlia bialata]|uniref:Bicarbonate transporter, eukaryotic n=1 Tax=Kipferlia bialata TaxID=797122 RepID=A0A9K3CNS5_9EUKA|nr:bicarbonate transporter, eukaryotic [Kipferlia bialata]|eukprot:g1474.t1
MGLLDIAVEGAPMTKMANAVEAVPLPDMRPRSNSLAAKRPLPLELKDSIALQMASARQSGSNLNLLSRPRAPIPSGPKGKESKAGGNQTQAQGAKGGTLSGRDTPKSGHGRWREPSMLGLPTGRMHGASFNAATTYSRNVSPCHTPTKAEQQANERGRHRFHLDPLAKSGKFFGGVKADVCRRSKWYVHDWVEGFVSFKKTLSTVFTLFLAVLTPTIAFGVFGANTTNHLLGVNEALIASGVMGLLWSACAGQPMILVGPTGLVMVFIAALYAQCLWVFGDDALFLPFYAWSCIWMGVACILMAGLEWSVLIRRFTRFIDEIHAALVSLIFLYDAFEELTHYASGEDVHTDSVIFSILITIVVAWLASQLHRARDSRFLSARARNFASEFAMPIAVLAGVGLRYVFPSVELEALELGHSDSESGESTSIWSVVDLMPGDMPWYMPLLCVFPGVFGAILLFIDEGCTARLINNPHKYKVNKGAAYHLDLCVIGVGTIVSGLFGWPIVVGSTVQSIMHVLSMGVVETTVDPHTKAVQSRCVRCAENRLSGAMIAALLLCSLLISDYLEMIPMPVYWGLFVFIGYTTLSQVQLWERIQILFMSPNLYPPQHYVRHVRKRALVAFTIVQAGILIFFFAVEHSSYGIIFPLFIPCLIPLREKLLPRFFTRQDLHQLDKEEEPAATGFGT